MIYSIRISDIPKFIIGFVIALTLLGGLIELWRLTGRMPDWVVYSALAGIMIVSFISADFIWKRIRRLH